MDIKTRNEEVTKFFKSCEKIIEAKGKDYNPNGLAFSEICLEAVDLNISPEKYITILMSKHWAAIKRYANCKKLESEPIQERLKDLANYCALFTVMIEAIEEE